MSVNDFNHNTPAIMKMVEAWERLPEGNTSVKVVERWLINDLQPAINVLRMQIPEEHQSEDTKRAIIRMAEAASNG